MVLNPYLCLEHITLQAESKGIITHVLEGSSFLGLCLIKKPKQTNKKPQQICLIGRRLKLHCSTATSIPLSMKSEQNRGKQTVLGPMKTSLWYRDPSFWNTGPPLGGMGCHACLEWGLSVDPLLEVSFWKPLLADRKRRTKCEALCLSFSCKSSWDALQVVNPFFSLAPSNSCRVICPV